MIPRDFQRGDVRQRWGSDRITGAAPFAELYHLRSDGSQSLEQLVGDFTCSLRYVPVDQNFEISETSDNEVARAMKSLISLLRV